MRASFLALLGVVLVAGCGGSSFDIADEAQDSGSDGSGDGVATEGGTDGTADGDDGAVDGTPGETSPTDGTVPPDTTPPPDGTACAPLAATATDIYVDKRFLGSAPTGTATCPFTTILAGIAALASLTSSGTKTIHVAGATPALVYNETDAVFLNHNVILLGDGPATTMINASGGCFGGTCAVAVNGGATLDGFTVTSSSGDGIVANLVSPSPIIKNVAATGSKGNGVSALGAVELGPNIVASKNGGQGVNSKGTGLVHINAASVGSFNAFDNNGANGINVEGGAQLKFDGGNAGGNAFNGIRLAGLPAGGGAPPNHTVTGLIAKNNKNTGISAFGGQNLKLRSSTLLTNANIGLVYTYAGTSVLDIGLTTDKGGNTFGGATVASRNGKAGIYLCKSRGTGTQPADSDSFSVCAPTQTSLPGCDTMPTSYTDVAYAPAIAGDPVLATSCTVGP